MSAQTPDSRCSSLGDTKLSMKVNGAVTHTLRTKIFVRLIRQV